MNFRVGEGEVSKSKAFPSSNMVILELHLRHFQAYITTEMSVMLSFSQLSRAASTKPSIPLASRSTTLCATDLSSSHSIPNPLRPLLPHCLFSIKPSPLLQHGSPDLPHIPHSNPHQRPLTKAPRTHTRPRRPLSPLQPAHQPTSSRTVLTDSSIQLLSSGPKSFPSRIPLLPSHPLTFPSSHLHPRR